MNERDALCHRCRAARVRVFGMQCQPCQAITDREYWAERERRGGKLLFLEDADLERVAAGLREDDVSFGIGNGTGSKTERNAQIVEMVRGGQSRTAVAAHFGLSPQRIDQLMSAARAAVTRPVQPTRPTERITSASVAQRAAKSPQELADALTERVLSVIDAFSLDFNLGNCLRLILERETSRGPEAERADLTWARKYLDRAIARLGS